MPDHRSFRFAVLIVLAALVYPAMTSAESPRKPPPGADVEKSAAQARTAGKVAIVSLSLEVPDVVRARIQSSIVAGFEAAGTPWVGYDRVLAAVGEQLAKGGDCTHRPDCLEAVANAMKVTRFLSVSVSGEGIAFKIAVGLWARKRRIKRVTQDCEPCSIGNLGRAITQATAQALAPPKPVPVQIASVPEGAMLYLDGKKLGTAPFEGKLSPGLHKVRATLEGHTANELKIEVQDESEVGDTVQPFSIALIPDARVGRPFVALKWVGAAATVGALGTSVAWLVLDGRETCSEPDPCPEIYETQTLGYIAGGVGVVLAAATVAMFWSDSKAAAMQKAAWTPALVPTRGGAMARFRVDF